MVTNGVLDKLYMCLKHKQVKLSIEVNHKLSNLFGSSKRAKPFTEMCKRSPFNLGAIVNFQVSVKALCKFEAKFLSLP